MSEISRLTGEVSGMRSDINNMINRIDRLCTKSDETEKEFRSRIIDLEKYKSRINGALAIISVFTGFILAKLSKIV